MAGKSKSKAKGKLEDIAVNELSMVDRAANKRRWLITKADGDPPAEPAAADPATPPVAADPPAVDPPATPAADPPATPPAGDPTPVPAADPPAPAPAADPPAPAPAGDPPAADPAAAAEVSKRASTKKWLAKLKAKHAAIADVIKELDDDLSGDKDDDKKDETEETKAALAKAATLEETVKRLEGEMAVAKKELAAAQTTIKKQAGVIAEAKLAAVGNSESDEGGSGGGDGYSWPSDMSPPLKTTARRQ